MEYALGFWSALKALAANGCRCEFHRLVRVAMAPQYAEIAVTNRCNARCRQCLEFGSVRMTAVPEGSGLLRFLIARGIQRRSRRAAIERLLEYGLDNYLMNHGAARQ